jgi:hypothetical protein
MEVQNYWKLLFQNGAGNRTVYYSDGYLFATLSRYAYVTGDTQVQQNLQQAIGAAAYLRTPTPGFDSLWRDDWLIPGAGHVLVFPGTQTVQQLLLSLPPIMMSAGVTRPTAYAFNGLLQQSQATAFAVLAAFSTEVAAGGPQIILAGHSLGATCALHTGYKLNTFNTGTDPTYVPPVASIYSFGCPAYWGDSASYFPPDIIPDYDPGFNTGLAHTRWYNPGDLICDLTTVIWRNQYPAQRTSYGQGFPPPPRHWADMNAPIQFGNSRNTVLSNLLARGVIGPYSLDAAALLSQAQAVADTINSNHSMKNYCGRLESILWLRPKDRGPMFVDLVAANRYMDSLGF